MPKVSVIVPVYNAEKYVERAIVSLMEQTLDDVEFIIIDDGSKDNSLVIIQQVMERYPDRKDQVILISRENRGVAATRAQGMELAKGEYTIHLDSDDWVELGWLESMYNVAKKDNADVVICDYSLVYKNNCQLIKQPPASTGLDCIKQLLVCNLHGSTWNKLISRKLCLDNKINVLDDINYLEDFYYIMNVFYFASKISYVSMPFLNYNQENYNSITKVIDKDKVKHIVNAIRYIENFLINKGLLDVLNYEINIFKLMQKTWIIYNNPKESFELFSESNKYIWGSSLTTYAKIALCLDSKKMYKTSFVFVKFILLLKYFSRILRSRYVNS
ncbi:glycosyltransferase family 2 protein [Tolumonas osonensis]|uniref:Glycosyltransferase involved in cell wall biosynthesis n=1 Tax=Tolumonas osonensis TaxID=675874 RepID=A0A841GJ33_9GAMM|nr:glycosyltransferase family 2 protein [Tolumonas osonensis]MBB6056696.1 glycosyltransferase involved in cell wall biosynthesis [Tolumonas osonensis]